MNEKKSVSALILDCDGVMFDSRQANTNFYNHILGHFGLPPMTEDKVAFVHMNTAQESIRHIFKGTSYEQDAQKYRLVLDYTPFVKDMIIEPDLKEVLRLLKPRVGLAVATNRSNTIGRVLETNGLTDFFDIVVSSLDVQNPKPHPESLFKILDFFSIGPDESVYVGDSTVDYDTAKAAGVHFVSFKNRGLKADFHVDRLRDVIPFLDSQGSASVG
jgi:phosphoglycolate phosphatase